MTTLHKSSYEKLKSFFNYCSVDDEYAEPMINYLVYGFNPGSFFTAVLANDFTGAMMRSHPANSVLALKNLVTWMINYMPTEAWGDYDKITRWVNVVDAEYRRQVLEEKGLIYTPQEETWNGLKG